MPGFQDFKRAMRELLLDPAWEGRLGELTRMPLKRALGPLFSFFCDADALVKWRAVTAFGVVVDALARQDMEAARVVMRRLMWSLNEESGAIGWGAPEAMGESMARNAVLATEYHRILISYAQEPERGDGNYLEHAPLRSGVYWGLSRLAEVRPELAKNALPALREGVGQGDPFIRALSALTLGFLGDPRVKDLLTPLLNDSRMIELYRHGVLARVAVADLAAEALGRLENYPSSVR